MTRFAASVGVLSEVELLPHCIAHLRRIGVHEIHVTVLGRSRDGTDEWLSANDAPDLHVTRHPEGTSDAVIMEEMARRLSALEADWILMLDADEFPLPHGGDLAAAFAGIEADLVRIPRYNVVLGPGGLEMPLPPGLSGYERIRLYARAEKGLRERLKAGEASAWLPFVPVPKIAVRPGRLGALHEGLHGAALPGGGKASRAVADRIVIAHAAMTSYARFEAKVKDIELTLARHEGEFSENFGWHWHRWARLAREGRLAEEFEASHADAAEIAAGLAEGRIASAAALVAPEKT